jgi:mono/diheme cytochrome c family protein
MRGNLFCVLAALVLSLTISQSASADSETDFFEARIRPVLAGTCFRCHGDQKTGAMLRVDSREALVKGGESGAAIVPGQPDESLLIKAIQRHESVSAMPPERDKALRPDQIADFVSWVKGGAAWPAVTVKFETSRHWAFEPVQNPAPPVVKNTAWVRTSIDPFILARQEEVGVSPAAQADKRTLIRRATFDLTGLPPTPDEIEAFERDSSANAFATVVERLLASSAYGEKWGRHWLDVVRYADTAGETADYPVPVAWRYRNYVIDSFNADKPYDEFLREQIAGDILAVQGPADRYAERTTATGYLAISRRFGFDSENYHHLTIQDTIDTLGLSVLGLSLGCARCHDHKFDTVTMRDYYGLYGVFDSSRYAFPGSEQKQKVRSMLPLLPPDDALPKWRAFDARIAAMSTSLEKQKQPVPGAILRSLNDMDGDFELQAPAAGGSNGVLVPPWLYVGKIAVTNAAQSPFKNLYPRGKVGASVPAGSDPYRIVQAIYPARSSDNCDVLNVNLDFRVTPVDGSQPGSHRFWIGSMLTSPAAEVLISSESISLRQGTTVEQIAAMPPGQWQNLQLSLNLKTRTMSGAIGAPGSVTTFSGKPLSTSWSGVVDFVGLDSSGEPGAGRPAIEYDNLGVQQAAIAAVSTEAATSFGTASGLDPVALSKELDELTGFDGDFELQTQDAAPGVPWGPGPNSVVKISGSAQSPFVNVYSAGQFGIHMPNRGEYDGFGRAVSNIKPNAEGHLFASFDFRCANIDAGGTGSWRYYLGHGPGNSAAVELFFNGSEFFRRSADLREAISPLEVGRWYHVQLSLDLNKKTYSGVLVSADRKGDAGVRGRETRAQQEETRAQRDGETRSRPGGKVEFSGQLATGWDGVIDYTFIDSYGHIGGVRPSLDADNFAIVSTPIPAVDASPVTGSSESREARIARVKTLRQQLADLMTNVELSKQELNKLLAEGPFEMTYGVTEGTPHNVRMQMRGEPDKPGDEVPRGFIKVLGDDALPAESTGSGRMELARWITRKENPLTSRVMSNRIWQYHFGRGLVKTPNDFGVRGMAPTHPELLDHLAHQFVECRWSVKQMHRLIMLSSTYQQASTPAAAGSAVADTTDLYAEFPRRRLDAEEIRDSILAVSGELDRTPGREHPFPTPISWGYSQHGPFSAVYDHNKRSVYLMTQRLKRHPFLALFDGADPNASTPDRLGTTVPTQALFFLNDPFVHAKSDKFAARLRSVTPDESQQIQLANRLALGRSVTDAERVEATQFLTAYKTELAATGQSDIEQKSLAAYVRTLFGSNEFLYLE